MSDYFRASGYAVTRAEERTSTADYGSAAMVCADADRLSNRPLRQSSGQSPIVVAVTPFGDATADAVIANGLADAAISRPLLRSEIEELLRRVAAGEKRLHSRAAGLRRGDPPPRFTNLRVLVADDSAVNREVAIEALSRLGAHVETVENGLQAVSAAARHSHDIILMDGSMPKMDGYTAARIIRQAEQAENRVRVPIVALTAHVIGAAAEEWRLAGMDAIIHKPFTIAQLADCLLDQVPQFQSPAGELVTDNDGGNSNKRQVELGQSSVDGDADLQLLDPVTLGQLRSLNEAKQGDFLKRVVDLYSEHAPKACDQLRQHAKAGEAEASGSLAHSLKSMSLNIGATEVAKMAAAFEQMARGEGRVPDQNELTALSNAMGRTLAALAHEIGETSIDQRLPETGDASPALVVPADSIERDFRLAIERGELSAAWSGASKGVRRPSLREGRPLSDRFIKRRRRGD